jgi:hypothetical protein
LDRCDERRLEGWVFDHDDPTRRFQLAVHCGATLLGTYTANLFRQDLADGGLAGGLCAFVVELPNNLTGSELQALRIDVDDTGYVFPSRLGGPVYGLTPGDLYKSLSTELIRSGHRWPKMGTCVLHIGTEKTGSTSLQSSFGLNRHIFEGGGYFIPQTLAPQTSDGTLKHSFLALISMSDAKFDDDLRRKFHMVDAESLTRGRRDIFRTFCDEMTAVPDSCHTVILSDEHCHSRLNSPEEVQNLKAFLDQFCEKYRIVVYLRPQHELAISQYGMFVANGIYDIDMLPRFPPAPESAGRTYTNWAYFDYKALLDRWAQVFGEKAICPRIYGTKDLCGGDVISDFISELSLVCAPLQLPPRRNSDISADAQALLLQLYRCLDVKKGSGAALLRERLRNAAQMCFPGTGAIAARNEVTAFLQQFSETNEAVRARWFPQRPRLFDIDLKRYPEKRAELVLTGQQIISMMLDVLLMDQEMSFSLTPEERQRLSNGLSPRPS